MSKNKGGKDPCCGKGAKNFKFHDIYVGFNEDIYEDLYGTKPKDPCCTNNLSSCRDANGNYSCGGMKNQSTSSQAKGNNNVDNSFLEQNKFNYMTCDSTPSSLCKKYDGCCKDKKCFKPLEVYTGFNQNIYLDTYGGTCIGPNTDKDEDSEDQGRCRYRY